MPQAPAASPQLAWCRLSAPHGMHLANKVCVCRGRLMGLPPGPLTLPNQYTDQSTDRWLVSDL